MSSSMTVSVVVVSNDDVSLLVYGPIDVPLGRVANMVTVLRMDKPPNGVMLIDDGI